MVRFGRSCLNTGGRGVAGGCVCASASRVDATKSANKPYRADNASGATASRRVIVMAALYEVHMMRVDLVLAIFRAAQTPHSTEHHEFVIENFRTESGVTLPK